MHGVEGVVDVEHDAPRHLPEAGAVLRHHGAAQAQQVAWLRQVLQPRDGRLRTQRGALRQLAQRQFESGIVPQAGGVVAVLIAGGDHQHSEAHDVGDAVRDALRIAWVGDAGGQTVGDAEALLDLAQRQDAAV